MKNKLIRVGKFLRILDDQENLSISNLTAILMMAKVMSTPALSMQDIAVALVALAPYTAKKIKGK